VAFCVHFPGPRSSHLANSADYTIVNRQIARHRFSTRAVNQLSTPDHYVVRHARSSVLIPSGCWTNAGSKSNVVSQPMHTSFSRVKMV
jgi:hypothetical protein